MNGPDRHDTFVPATRTLVLRMLTITYHRILSRISKGGFVGVAGRVAFAVAYAWIPVSAHFKLKAEPITKLALFTFGGGLIWKGLKLTMPEGMTYVSRHYLERKYLLSAKIDAMGRMASMAAAEVQRYREEVLQIIAQYVRDHRGDFAGRSIFANLLVVDGEDIVVLARDREHRQPAVRCRRSEMVATEVFLTGEIQVIGDLVTQIPNAPKKPYSSFMVMPIRLGKAIVGALSIDSAERYHFDFQADELAVSLLPYISLLAWTLTPARAKEALT